MPIPEAKRPAVDRALTAAFGTTEMDSAKPLTGGLSGASVYRIRVGGIAYLLRIEGARDDFRDPGRWYGCMGAAAAAYIAPRVRYADAADGVAIMDFIEEQSLVLDYRGTRADLIVEAAQTIRALHETPAFPPLIDYMDGMDGLIGVFQASGLIAPAAVEELFARYAVLRAGYRTAEGDRVSSHNDLNPRNILYDGGRLWLVDWESSFLADRYVDLATLANVFAHTPEEEALLATTYFGQAPTAERQARLYLMRQINQVFYGVILLNGVAAECPDLRETSLEAPSLAEIHQALGTGDFALETWRGRLAYGKARLNAALDGLRSARFPEALALVAA
ncbi:phosphotransferase [Phenylobacterium sp. LH3H17]|uniref:phosphotransferase n=1 Tax=Phenylobacterium sp. LH3H17 TaxID=2903901 RepID=UPI0020C987AA|nr:phosphotransferase [Phenylobacterium sp. LH3H17]UTP39992.1 phosphotransferase [Phenylobacterium sp. LH3H17]